MKRESNIACPINHSLFNYTVKCTTAIWGKHPGLGRSFGLATQCQDKWPIHYYFTPIIESFHGRLNWLVPTNPHSSHDSRGGLIEAAATPHHRSLDVNMAVCLRRKPLLLGVYLRQFSSQSSLNPGHGRNWKRIVYPGIAVAGSAILWLAFQDHRRLSSVHALSTSGKNKPKVRHCDVQ